MKYIISTLGCKVNQYETQAMEEILKLRGHSAVEDSGADVIIVNTCAVTAESGRKCRQTIRAMQEKNPGAMLAVCGCYAQVAPDVMEELGADVLYGSGDRLRFVDDIEKAYLEKQPIRNIDEPFGREQFEELPAGSYSGRTRAMIKVQDGCTNFCTYCIIPFARGALRSLPVENAVSQAKGLREEGYKELVITGIAIASYGYDLKEDVKLDDLIAAIAENVPEMRLRLGSLEPTVITEEFCKRISAYPNICRHFHLSLQSGCDRTLKAMNRKYDTAAFYHVVELLRHYFPGCGLTADLIVGFPDETEEDFQNTLDFLRKCSFSQVHIFPYSRRKGTVADTMDHQITNGEKKRRAHLAKEVTDGTRRDFLEGCIGETLPVLFETTDGKIWQGHSDTYLNVLVEGENLRGFVKNVKIKEVKGENLVGVML